MSDTARFAELDEQHGELLPARTVLSLFSAGPDAGTAGTGASCAGKLGLNVANIPLVPGGGNCVGAPGANADGS